MSETYACSAKECGTEIRMGDESRCDDCNAILCDDHLTTCSGDGEVPGCDAGLCPDCNEEHASEHLYEQENESAGE